MSSALLLSLIWCSATAPRQYSTYVGPNAPEIRQGTPVLLTYPQWNFYH
jgi:hypothetical protein